MGITRYAVTPRTYVIRDRPFEGLPVSRLQKEGGDVVPVADLVRIVLGGIPDLEQKLKEYGAGFLSSVKTVDEIEDVLKLDRIQATRLLAVLAIGRRLFAGGPGSLATIRGIEDVYGHCRQMAGLAKEQLRLLLINARYQLLHEEVLAMGGGDSLHVSTRDVIQPAVERGAPAIILVHNHPSGDPRPSREDYDFTARIQAAAELLDIELLDHVIIGREGWASCLSPKAA